MAETLGFRADLAWCANGTPWRTPELAQFVILKGDTMTIRERLTNWLAGEDVGNLRWNHAQAMKHNAYLRAQLSDIQHRIADRDAGVVPNRTYGKLPDASFVGLHDYGKGVTREEALTYSAIRHPASGLTIKIEDGQLTVRGSDGHLRCALTAREGV